MAAINVPYLTAAVTADSTVGGYITVAGNAGYVVGAEVAMSGTGKPTQHYQITDLSGTTKIGLRLVTYPKTHQGYGRSDVSTYTLAAASKITQASQQVFVSTSRGLPAPSSDGQTLKSDSTQPDGVKWV